jgi:AraC-like DNA-binding protein
MKPELIIDAPILNKKEIWVKKINKPHFDHPFHFHQLCELVWVEKSYGKLIIGDYVGSFSEGEVILVAPQLPHLWQCDPIFYTNKKELYTNAVGLYFPQAFVTTITDDPNITGSYKQLLTKAQRGLRFYGKTKDVIIEKIKAICNTEAFEQLGYFLHIIDILIKTSEYELLAGLNYKSIQNENDMTRFNEVNQFLLKNFNRDISLGEVAKICNLTPNAFCRFFKLKTQKTFIRFLNEIRIGHACVLLQNQNNTINDIIYECGFNNPINFYKFFKQITNKTPKEYRVNFDQKKIMRQINSN